jgi:antitoxin component YwqK of YwqJK toxin-antitoxin module
MLCGASQIFYPKTGVLQLEAVVVDDKLDGVSKEYYPSGALKKVSHYKDNKKEGIETEYDPDGGILHENIYQSGIQVTAQIPEQEGLTISGR